MLQLRSKMRPMLFISLVITLMVTSAITQPILQDTCPVIVSLRESSVSTSSAHPCGDGNWRQIAYLNMSNPSQQCPPTFREYSSPERSCGRPVTFSRSCVSVFYSSNSYQYQRVCGRIIGYYWGTGGPDAVADLGFHEGGFVKVGRAREIFLQTTPTSGQKPRPFT